MFMMRLLRNLASLKLAVVCLLFLFLLVFLGTLYQVEHGLYAAKLYYFDSWFMLLFGWVPFPGAQLVLSVIFINILAAAVVYFYWSWGSLGILLIHAGLLLLLFGGWLIHLCAQESFLSLLEGEQSNVSASYEEWEISVWEEEPGVKNVMAKDANAFQAGDKILFSELGVTFTVERYLANAQAFTSTNLTSGSTLINKSGIQFLEPIPINKEPVQNIPGGIFALSIVGESAVQRILLFGNDVVPHTFKVKEKTYSVALRRKRFVLPVVVKLKDFRRQMHPNTQIPKSFSSQVEINNLGVKREVWIQMNEPFRYKGYTLYQASYAVLDGGRESSTFAVVKNSGRLLPYIASVITFLGLFSHFVMKIYNRNLY